MQRAGRVAGKVALITGGASGIGRATALLFAREGAAIALADLNADEGQRVADEIIKAGGRAFIEPMDVTRAADCRRLVEHAIRELGRIDILFNNAGIIRRATVLDLSEEDWDRVMAVNVKSIYLLSREVIPHMQKAGGGTIINTASGWGLAGGAKAAVYCASKGAVVLLTKAMAIDHGPQSIRVNCICPAIPILACCAPKRSNSEKRTTAFLPKRQSVRWAGWGRRRKLRRPRCIWRAMRLRLSPARRWLSMVEGWRDRFD